MTTPVLETNSKLSAYRQIWLLSLISIAPLLVLALILVTVDRANATFFPLLDAFKTGSVVLLSFVGGVRWGLALHNSPPQIATLIISLIPAACGWISLFLPEPFSVALLLIAFCATGAWDSLTFNNEINAQKFQLRWYANIRTVITLILALAHGVVLIAILN